MKGKLPAEQEAAQTDRPEGSGGVTRRVSAGDGEGEVASGGLRRVALDGPTMVAVGAGEIDFAIPLVSPQDRPSMAFLAEDESLAFTGGIGWKLGHGRS